MRSEAPLFAALGCRPAGMNSQIAQTLAAATKRSTAVSRLNLSCDTDATIARAMQIMAHLR
jgi:hypothetical protein